MRKTNLQDRTFILTILIFLLGMIHISLALIGLLCYLGPLVTYLKTRDKTWCRELCPRAGFLTKSLKHISLGLMPPKWLSGQSVKDFFVTYIGLNLVFATMSTLMVALGRIAPMPYIRLFMVFRAPFILPQLVIWPLPDFLIHLSYRVYSMLLSSLLIGLVLGVLFRPRTWCSICPVNTLSTPKLKKN